MAKKKRRRFEVFHDRDGWHGRELARGGYGAHGRTKKAVVDAVVAVARSVQPSQLFIKGRDGKIQDERTYGNDPRRTKG